MKKLILSIALAIAVSLPSAVLAQTLSPKVIASGGGYFTGGGNSLSWTLGETFTTTLQAGGLMLTQGQQQPYITLKILNLRAFIEGFYMAGTSEMQPVLMNAGVGSDPLVSDSIIVSLHEQFNPSIVAASETVPLHTDGWAQVTLPGALMGGSYYVSIRTRNSIETWSKLPLTLSAVTTFDFTEPE